MDMPSEPAASATGTPSARQRGLEHLESGPVLGTATGSMHYRSGWSQGAARVPGCNVARPAHRLKRASIMEADMVWVDPYVRIRFGRLEHVSGHYRSLPRR